MNARTWTAARWLGFIALLVSSRSSRAQESTNNGMPIRIAPQAPGVPGACVSDGAGGTLVLWSQNSDAYAERLNPQGLPLWGPASRVVATASGGQSPLSVAANGGDGAFFAWNDDRISSPGRWDIYVQSVDLNGNAKWSPGGIRLTSPPHDYRYVNSTLSDGTGGAVAVWTDLRTGNWDVYAQRIDQTGALVWQTNGVPVTAMSGDQLGVGAAPDGQGGAIVVWYGANYRLFAQRVSSAGSLLWDPAGVPICPSLPGLGSAQVASDGQGGAVIAWADSRIPNDTNVYAQRIGPSANLLWDPAGVAVCNDPSYQDLRYLGADGVGGAIAAWIDRRFGSDDIYAQRLAPAGTPQWVNNGVAIRVGQSYGTNFAASPDGAGGLVLEWQDNRLVNPGFYAQRMDEFGSALFTENGLLLSKYGGSPVGVVPDGPAGMTCIWVDGRTSRSGIYGQKVSGQGTLLWPDPEPPRLVNVRDVPNDQGGNLKLSWEASSLDPAYPFLIQKYWVWRSVPPNLALASSSSIVPLPSKIKVSSSSTLRTSDATGDTYWEYVSELPAGHLGRYSFTAATKGDSVPGSNPQTRFMIQAWGGQEWWFSNPDSGYSVDNLSPAQPVNFSAQATSHGTVLHWKPNQESDLLEYRLYRGSSPFFEPSASNLITAQADTGFRDLGWTALSFYKLAAVDAHGNRSLYALAQVDLPTPALVSLVDVDKSASRVRVTWYVAANAGVPANVYRRSTEGDWALLGTVSADGGGRIVYEDASVISGEHLGYRLGIWNGDSEAFGGEIWVDVPQLSTALNGVQPNPARNGWARVELELPDGGPTMLDLIDVTGRILEHRDVGGLGAGRHEVPIAAFARPGLYLVRLSKNGNVWTRKLAVVR